MDIKDFIEGTLVQINEGIKNASKHTSEHYEVSPGDKGTKGVFFSLAVTNSEVGEKGSNKAGGIHIKVVDARLGSSDKSSISTESISRIEFDIIVD